MTEVLVEFDTILRDDDGSRWTARAGTRLDDDGLWEGWIEFTPMDSSLEPIRASCETEQANRNAVLYWAEGLSQTYLEGALKRARSPGPMGERRETNTEHRAEQG